MLALIIASILALVTGVGSFLIDQRSLRCGTIWRAWPSTILVVVAVWVAVLILASMLLKTPGAYGPVQFWINSPAADWFMMGPRVWTMFITIAGALFLVPLTILTFIVSLFFYSKHNRWYRIVVPLAAITMFAFSYFLYSHYEFYPSA